MITIFSSYQSDSDAWHTEGFSSKSKLLLFLQSCDWMRNRKSPDTSLSPCALRLALSPHTTASTCPTAVSWTHLLAPPWKKTKWLHQRPATAHSKSSNSQITWNDPITVIFIPNVSQLKSSKVVCYFFFQYSTYQMQNWQHLSLGFF